MIENKDLGVKIAENQDEVFWTETKEKCQEGIKAETRNIEINKKIIELCDEQIKKLDL